MQKERQIKIKNSRYNKWYKMIKEKGIPEYPKKSWSKVRCRRIARFRLGNEMGESRY